MKKPVPLREQSKEQLIGIVNNDILFPLWAILFTAVFVALSAGGMGLILEHSHNINGFLGSLFAFVQFVLLSLGIKLYYTNQRVSAVNGTASQTESNTKFSPFGLRRLINQSMLFKQISQMVGDQLMAGWR